MPLLAALLITNFKRRIAEKITGKKISVLYIIIGQQNKPLLVFDDHEDG